MIETVEMFRDARIKSNKIKSAEIFLKINKNIIQMKYWDCIHSHIKSIKYICAHVFPSSLYNTNKPNITNINIYKVVGEKIFP